MNLYRSVIGPALFKLPADRGHDLAHRALAWPPPWRALSAASGLVVTDPRLKTRFAGLDLPNPVGLAAGFDKDAELTDALSWLGFGFICVGSIMPEPRPGNPFPRLVRFTHNASLADSMGVPSRGRGYAIARLRRRKSCQTSARAVPIFANIGGFSADSLAQGIAELRPLVDAVEISLMCPNVQAPGETFDEIGMLRGLIDRLTVDPGAIVVRVPNDTTLNHDRFAELVELCIEAKFGGLKVGGGRRIIEPKLGSGSGTLHGRAIFETALANVARAAQFARGRIAIKGNGGISSVADVMAMRRAGAVCVDLYSAFIYHGWTVARDINRELLAMIDRGEAVLPAVADPCQPASV